MAGVVELGARSVSVPPRNGPATTYRRGYIFSQHRFAMPHIEEHQFFVRMKPDTKQMLQVSDDDNEDKEDKERVEKKKVPKESEEVTLMLQEDRLVVVRRHRSWAWKLGLIRRYGYSQQDFYFESGRKARTGEGIFVFLTLDGKRIHTRLNMMKEFCQFDLYCQRGIIPNLPTIDNPPNRATSLKDKSEKYQELREKKERRPSTGSLP